MEGNKKENLNVVTIVPDRELKPNEEIIDIYKIKDGNKFHVGFIINVSESASKFEYKWIGAKVYEEKPKKRKRTNIFLKLMDAISKSDHSEIPKNEIKLKMPNGEVKTFVEIYPKFL